MTFRNLEILFIYTLITLFFPTETLCTNIDKSVLEDGSFRFSDHILAIIKDIDTGIDENCKYARPGLIKTSVDSKEDYFRDPIEKIFQCIFIVKNGKRHGTGFFISPKGYAITSRHLIEDNSDYIAVLYNNNKYPIGIISTSKRYDLALILVITPLETSFLTIRDPYTLFIDEQVFTIGYSQGLIYSITKGRFSGFRMRKDTGNDLLQFSAPVHPGNSGCPLVDINGQVVGVVSWKIISQNGVPVEGIGFAVPSYYIHEEYGSYGDLN